MNSQADRIGRVRERMTEQMRAAEQRLAETPTITMSKLVERTMNSFRNAVGPDAPLPTPLRSLRYRQEVERMSRESMKVREIKDALGISYGYVVDLRRQLSVSKPRKPR